MISGKTKVTGIFGCPVSHTMSPLIHNAAFATLGIDYVYAPFEVKPQNLKDAVDGIRAMNVAGVNVTIPHKENVIKYLDKINPLAKAIGSVNTIVNDKGKLMGYNTDGAGFLKDLKFNGIDPKGKTALIIGAGGAGRAIACSLSLAGTTKIYITDVDSKKARALSKCVKRAVFEPVEKFYTKIPDCRILVNATPLGMSKNDPSPVEDKHLYPGIFVYDVVYNRQTKLIKAAKEKKLRCCDGLGMLLYQGALSFELWTGKKAPVKVMRKTLLDNIKN